MDYNWALFDIQMRANDKMELVVEVDFHLWIAVAYTCILNTALRNK